MFKHGVSESGARQVEFRDADGDTLTLHQSGTLAVLCIPTALVPDNDGVTCSGVALARPDVAELYRQLGAYLINGELDIDLTWG